ncbi:MAG: transposase [Thermoplasmata archaeon]|nr:transposase [Candidatus Sysuiplasma acidicola]MBX8638581.1 transposase [Candidatus Sysuiplasma acidicola]
MIAFPLFDPLHAAKLKRSLALTFPLDLRSESQHLKSKDLIGRDSDMLFTFLKLPGVSWHNNAAENAVRQGVLHRKISGGRKTWKGADSLQCILSVYRTSLKKGINFTELVLKSLVNE